MIHSISIWIIYNRKDKLAFLFFRRKSPISFTVMVRYCFLIHTRFPLYAYELCKSNQSKIFESLSATDSHWEYWIKISFEKRINKMNWLYFTKSNFLRMSSINAKGMLRLKRISFYIESALDECFVERNQVKCFMRPLLVRAGCKFYFIFPQKEHLKIIYSQFQKVNWK